MSVKRFREDQYPTPTTRRRGSRAPSPLAAVRTEFARIAHDRVEFDPRIVPEWAVARLAGHGVLTWGRLRARLCDDRQLPLAVVDAVWRWLVIGARTGDRNAVMTAIGMAVPTLAALAARCGRRDRDDIEAFVIEGFLTELTRVDLDRPCVLIRLRWAAYTTTRRWLHDRDATPEPVAAITHEYAASAGYRVMSSPSGSPEVLLAEAVAQGVLTPLAAELIAATRLERRTLAAFAIERGDTYARLDHIRRRAEHALAAWLATRATETDSASTSDVEAHALQIVTLTTTAEQKHLRPPAAKSGSQNAVPLVQEKKSDAPDHAAAAARTKDTRRCA
ncbi:hypothetical protein GZH49_12230 [Nocardia terpenica]|uniref:hypothetical protein n=1 Tax=Nocardia terpenica TaxID=455432 RepID=UPI002FE17236